MTVDRTKGKATEENKAVEETRHRINLDDKLLYLPFNCLENPQVWKENV